jgi:hypothetical protein
VNDGYVGIHNRILETPQTVYPKHVANERSIHISIHHPRKSHVSTLTESITQIQFILYYVVRCSVVVSIPNEVIFLNLPNPSVRTRPWGLLSL